MFRKYIEKGAEYHMGSSQWGNHALKINLETRIQDLRNSLGPMHGDLRARTSGRHEHHGEQNKWYLTSSRSERDTSTYVSQKPSPNFSTTRVSCHRRGKPKWASARFGAAYSKGASGEVINWRGWDRRVNFLSYQINWEVVDCGLEKCCPKMGTNTPRCASMVSSIFRNLGRSKS